MKEHVRVKHSDNPVVFLCYAPNWHILGQTEPFVTGRDSNRESAARDTSQELYNIDDFFRGLVGMLIRSKPATVKALSLGSRV